MARNSLQVCTVVYLCMQCTYPVHKNLSCSVNRHACTSVRASWITYCTTEMLELVCSTEAHLHALRRVPDHCVAEILHVVHVFEENPVLLLLLTLSMMFPLLPKADSLGMIPFVARRSSCREISRGSNAETSLGRCGFRLLRHEVQLA